ncbi:ABC transporter permease [Paenibacillus physcomitrellae]|uniref:ABC transporter permease n=1 Tax=Paenibacillus physcomitrellae TaxID=1619311 RepID=A0ABQ1GCR9_9BACL|nr:ABC transporter permease [Paenibacillus physcomitrellae]GGA41144.1 ABC transporter permease [Paenibacillus physcomitrellae]
MSTNIQSVQEAILMKPVVREPSRAGIIWREFRTRKAAMTALIVLTLIVSACLFANLISPYDPNAGEISDRLKPIGTAGHVLGTDEQGRDLLTRILYGGRLSLLSGILPVLVSSIIGGLLGIIAGYFGGVIGSLIMRALDIVFSFPAILLAIGIAAALGPGIGNILISASVVFVPPVARVAENAVKDVRKEEYIEAAKSSGASSALIIRYHIFKNIFARLFVFSTSQIGVCLMMASGLSFLGLGVSPPTPEWGFMLNNLKQLIFIEPLVTIVPGIFIFVTSLCLNLVSDALSDAFELKR